MAVRHREPIPDDRHPVTRDKWRLPRQSRPLYARGGLRPCRGQAVPWIQIFLAPTPQSEARFGNPAG
eukprot:16043423-Heterocapsa_arctica.AAC.1